MTQIRLAEPVHGARVLGLGSAQPEHIVTNDDLAKRVETDDAWIRSRVGIAERRIADEATSLPGAREGVTIRRVASHDNGLPVAADLVIVHEMLEKSFEDHFNSYRESFPEFVQRLREDPGHRWDHWWLAELTDESARLAARHQSAERLAHDLRAMFDRADRAAAEAAEALAAADAAGEAAAAALTTAHVIAGLAADRAAATPGS